MTSAHEVAVEAMARAIREAPLRSMGKAHIIDPDASIPDSDLLRGRAALTALLTLHPGIAAVIAGEAVIVPREPDDDLRRVVWRAQYLHQRAVGGPSVQVDDDAITALVEAKVCDPAQRAHDRAAYAAQIAASPYAPTAAAGEGA